MSVLVFRPKEKLASSIEFMQRRGLNAVGVGLLEIQPIQKTIDQFVEKLRQMPALEQAQSACIFVSTYAADLITEHLDSWPQNLAIFAVGPSTAEHLFPLSNRVIQPDQANSEGLLKLPQFTDVQDKAIYIAKGVAGRNTLQTELSKRGAKITEVDLYQRQPCLPMVETHKWHSDDIQIAIATSGELLQAAFEHFDHHWLKSLKWVLVSRRLAEFAATLGINKIYQSAGAKDAQLIDTVNQILER